MQPLLDRMEKCLEKAPMAGPASLQTPGQPQQNGWKNAHDAMPACFDS